MRKCQPAGGIAKLLLVLAFLLAGRSSAQTTLPFQVSNPKHKKWPEQEAVRIYFSACELAAQAIRPEHPPRLEPKFVLVLGASDNETVRNGNSSEIRLKNWKPEGFAQAVVVMALREVLPSEKVAELVRSAILSSEASVSVTELKAGH